MKSWLLPGRPEGPVDAKKLRVADAQAAGEVKYNLVASLLVPTRKAKYFKFWQRIFLAFILIPLSLGSNGLSFIGPILDFT